MNITKINRTIFICLIISPLLILSCTGYVNSNVNAEESEGFQSYEHDLKQGFINESADDREIFYWIQVSDIHLDMSEKGKETRDNFKSFCNETIPEISPGFVISSGDNVNGPLNNSERPKQHYESEEEHQFFHNTLEDNGLNSSFYYSSIGNHETYNLGTDRSLFKEYIRNSTKYYFDVDAPSGTYRFVSLDTTQNVGLGNPFDYWGEMKSNRLNEIETLIEESPETIDQLVFFGHHPIHHIYSGRSDSGKTFKDLIAESDAATYLCGHTHTKNTYWNHGDFTELVSPAFTNGGHFRILAIDNGLHSFSEQITGEWPAIVITNPVSNLFYNEQADFSSMVNGDEIRALIFDSNPITEAYVEIDGDRIGEMTNQSDNLWTLSYDTEKYNSGDHNLKVVAKSESGELSQSITFNLDDFAPVQTDGMTKYLIGVNIFILLSVLLAICFLLLYSFSLFPKLYYYSSEKRQEALSEINVEDFDDKGFIQRHFHKKWVEAAKLPTASWLALVLPPAYLLLGPIFIGPFVNSTWGTLWLYGFSILGRHVLDFYSLIWSAGFLILFGIVEGFTIRGNQPHPSKWRYVPMIFYFLAWIAVIWFYSGYFTLPVMLVNPMILISFGVGIFLIWQSRKNHSREGSKRG
ncbi:MAG: metallophosphoesterase [Promethearchaeia archaeon]